MIFIVTHKLYRGIKMKIAILGSGLVAKKIASYLTEEELVFFSTAEQEIKINNKTYRSKKYEELENEKFKVAFGATTSENIEKHYKKLHADLLIDNSEFFRQSKLVPLVACGANDFLIQKDSTIIANPNCVSIMILNLLFNLNRFCPISKVILTSLQSVSGLGEKALIKLDKERSDYEYLDKRVVPQFEFGGKLVKMYDNIVPYVGSRENNGKTHEENKISLEMQKVINPQFELDAMCIRVPVTIGHTAVLHITLKEEFNYQKVMRLIDLETNIKYKEILTLEDVQKDEENIFATSLEKDPYCPYGFSIVLMSNNLTIGAALNSIRIYRKYKELSNVL
ncbi:MAG TPA: hypothetical protein DCY93_01525 [Firmicutes bacterium]|nr:hypothetical protein [Bacillota bacterium]